MNFNYGKSLADKQKVAFDRTDCYGHTPNMMIFGQAGTGKTWAVVNEIQQVLDNTEDDVIILDTEGFYTRDERIKSKIVRIAPFEPDSKWHINPFDLTVSENKDFKSVLEGVKDKAVSIFEEIIGRRMESFERATVHIACDRVFKPFIERLERTGEQCNHELNPTLSDVTDEIIGYGNATDEENRKLINALKAAIKENKNENNKLLAEKVDMLLEKTFYDFEATKLKRDLLGCLPLIREHFSYKMNMPSERAMQLSWYCSHKLYRACNLACLYYVWDRLVWNRIKDTRKRLWIYQEDTDTVFRESTMLSDVLADIYRRCRLYGGIMTLVSQSVADVIRGTDGKACFDNTSTFLVFGLCSEDARIMLQISGFGTKDMMCVKNGIAGIGTLYREHNWTPVTFRE